MNGLQTLFWNCSPVQGIIIPDMRSAVAVILVLSQLQWLPGAFVCSRQRAATDPCAQKMASGPAVGASAAQSHGAVGCTTLGPCAAVSPVVLPSAAAAFAGEVVRVAVPSAPARFVGFVSPPLSPPPQA